MKNHLTTKWNDLKGWFFSRVLIKYFGKQITESVLIVNEDGTLPYTVTEHYVILTFNGGGKIQISKDRFWEVVNTNKRSDEPTGAFDMSNAPAFVDPTAIEAHNDFLNRDKLRPMTDVMDADSYYDKKALKKQVRNVDENRKNSGTYKVTTQGDKNIKKRLGSRKLTKEERDAFAEVEAKKNETEHGIPENVRKQLFAGGNNAEDYNPPVGPKDRG